MYSYQYHCVYLQLHTYVRVLIYQSAKSPVLQASQDKKSVDVGANLFVGNLDPVSDLDMLNIVNVSTIKH